MDMFINILLVLAGFGLGVFVFFIFRKKIFSSEFDKIESLKCDVEKQNKTELENLIKNTNLELKEEFIKWKNEYNQKHSSRQSKLNEMEKRLIQKEENLDRRYTNLDNKEKDLKKREKDVMQHDEENQELKKKLIQKEEEQNKKLEQIAGMTTTEAIEQMKNKYEGEAKLEAAKTLKVIEKEYKEKADLIGRDVISTSIQRIASEHVMSSAVTVIDLPSDDMKGRIIGREGRNIRALETATGVDFIVDDTPEAIIVSSFDPIRREKAKQTLQTLISDGRIHPARIEEVVNKIEKDFDDYLRKIGEDAVLELGIQNLNPELHYYIGKLKFRTSFGQNVLAHSKEVALIGAFMATELGVSENVAKRAGLLHDLGKSIDRETEGTHTELSVELARKYGESKIVQEAIASHHMDVEFTSVEGVIVQASDSVSASRPGARREIFETYIKRLENLEEASVSFDGVTKAYALRAGREVRVIINSNELDDNKTYIMSKDIAKKVQDELEYPGQIKITVIREIRAVEYAK